jgi:hypothetical protein
MIPGSESMHNFDGRPFEINVSVSLRIAGNKTSFKYTKVYTMIADEI